MDAPPRGEVLLVNVRDHDVILDMIEKTDRGRVTLGVLDPTLIRFQSDLFRCRVFLADADPDKLTIPLYRSGIEERYALIAISPNGLPPDTLALWQAALSHYLEPGGQIAIIDGGH